MIRFNPLWGVPNAIRGSVSLMGDMFEVFTNLPILGYKRRNLSSLSRMSSKALKKHAGDRAMVADRPVCGAAKDRRRQSHTGRLVAQSVFQSTYFENSFGTLQNPSTPATQAIVNSRISVDHYYDVGLLGSPNLLVGDLSGGFTLDVHEYAEQPIVQTLGIEVASRTSDDRKPPIATLKPVMPFWMSCDLRYDTGDTITWRGKTSPAWGRIAVHPSRTTRQDYRRTGNSRQRTSSTTTRGPAIQECCRAIQLSGCHLASVSVNGETRRNCSNSVTTT